MAKFIELHRFPPDRNATTPKRVSININLILEFYDVDAPSQSCFIKMQAGTMYQAQTVDPTKDCFFVKENYDQVKELIKQSNKGG